MIEDIYSKAIRSNFPNLSTEELSSAESGRELRALLQEDRKIELFPNKKELQNILASATLEALFPLVFEHKKTHHQLKRKTKDYEDIIGFYYVRGSIDPTYSRRFLWLEELMSDWAKNNNLDEIKFTLSFYFPLSSKFDHPIYPKSYQSLANQFYDRLKYIKEVLIPEYHQLESIDKLNQKLNYGSSINDNFNGYKRGGEYDTRVLLPNSFVSVLANDPNSDNIIEKEVLKYLSMILKRKNLGVLLNN